MAYMVLWYLDLYEDEAACDMDEVSLTVGPYTYVSAVDDEIVVGIEGVEEPLHLMYTRDWTGYQWKFLDDKEHDVEAEYHKVHLRIAVEKR